jgi:hypothetical protein
MSNQLFQTARNYVQIAKNCEPSERQEAISRAKNALSSAYANTTVAEQKQLRELQEELNTLS